LTLVYQIDLDVTRLLWVGRERTIESFQGFFTVIGDELASKIVFVCSDMWEPYLKVIREKCSEALHILDRFHIVAKMNKALDEVRRRIAPHSERGRRARAEEVALAAAQTRTESENGTALPVARSAPLQPEDRTCLPS
jgi:Transposase and inactivated derivatives